MDVTIDEVANSAIASPLPVRPGKLCTRADVTLLALHCSTIPDLFASEYRHLAPFRSPALHHTVLECGFD